MPQRARRGGIHYHCRLLCTTRHRTPEARCSGWQPGDEVVELGRGVTRTFPERCAGPGGIWGC